MLERDDHERHEGIDPLRASGPEGADGSTHPAPDEPITAEFADIPARADQHDAQPGTHQADSHGAATNQVRSYLESVEPVFQAELADVSPEASPDPPPRKRRVMLPVVLFSLTCISTFVAGACAWWPADYLLSPPFAQDLRVESFNSLESPLRRVLLSNWSEGLVYMVCVLAILFTHEMGHFLATVRYKIPASLPFFLPFPIAPLGTLGAVIGMDGRRANRKEIFDIGIAGPLAGLAVAIPVLWIGIGSLDMGGPAHGMFQVEPPLIAKWMLAIRQPAGYVPGDMIWQSQLNPFLMAGWFGMIITGVNMMPVSQLDGGHVIYTLFGKRARWVARAFIVLTIAAMAMDWVNRGLFLMLLMILFIGVDHPPTRDDTVPLGSFRTVLGYASLAIPFICFAPRLFHS